MRVLVVNPVGHSSWDEQDRRIYEEFASQGTEITVRSLPEGPRSVETPEAHAEVTYRVVKLVKEIHEGFDGVIVNCFFDPGVDMLKGMIKQPVVGPCESSLALASLIGRKVLVASVGNEALWIIDDRIRQLGLSSFVVGIKGIPYGVLDIDSDRDGVKKALISVINKEIRARGVDVAVLGCTGLAGLAREVQKAVGIPVIDPAGAALKALEGLIKLGLYNGLFGR